MKTQKSIPAASLAVALAMPLGAAVLTDPSFEGSLSATGSGAGKWEPFNSGGGNIYEISTANPNTGAQNLQLTLVDINAFAGVFQDIAVLAGGSVTFSGFHALLSGTAGGSEIRIEWRDSVANTEISRTPNLAPAIAGSTYESFSLTDTVPAGADTARLVYASQSFGGALSQIAVDDLDVSGSGVVVPEPSALLLGGLGLLSLIRRRR